MAMERMKGWTLEVMLRDLSLQQVSLPCQVGLTLVHQIADGLCGLHEQVSDSAPTGLVHLGVTPANLMMRKEGSAALFDFGETVAAGAADGVVPDSRGGAYQAPERLRMLPVDCRADIFSLGRVLESVASCMDPEDLKADLPALIARACSVHAEERFSNMRQFMEAIEVVASNRQIEFSCYVGSRFMADIFGGSELQANPRAHSPRSSASPMRMPSEGLATAFGSALDSEPSLKETTLGEASYETGADKGIDPDEVTSKGAVLALGAVLGQEEVTSKGEPMPMEDTERSAQPQRKFVDEHAAVTVMGAPQDMEGLARSEESTEEGAARLAASGAGKAWPEELVATKAYNSDPETDDELASAIERRRKR